MARKIRRDDTVVVIGGKDRGKTGKVLRVDAKRDRVFVEGLNMIKRHQRPFTLQGQQREGGVIEREGPIHISNVAIADPKDEKPTRIGTIKDESGTRRRVAKRSGQQID
jgi:large subunit ribosomal protein L24